MPKDRRGNEMHFLPLQNINKGHLLLNRIEEFSNLLLIPLDLGSDVRVIFLLASSASLLHYF